MEGELRRSKRTITIRRDPEYIYEEECVNSVFKRSVAREEIWHTRHSSEVENAHALISYSEENNGGKQRK